MYKNGSGQSPIVDIKTVFFFFGDLPLPRATWKSLTKGSLIGKNMNKMGYFFSNFCLIPGGYIPLFH
jgi:hypothetical protein